MIFIREGSPLPKRKNYHSHCKFHSKRGGLFIKERKGEIFAEQRSKKRRG